MAGTVCARGAGADRRGSSAAPPPREMIAPLRSRNRFLATYLLLEADRGDAPPAKLAAAFPEAECNWIFYSTDFWAGLPEEATVVTYLGDAAMAGVVTAAAQRGWHLAVMPHPKMRHMRIGFGISTKLNEAIEDFRAAEQPQRVDLLRCNDSPVLNAVLIGESANLLLGIDRGLSWWQRVRKFVGESRRGNAYTPAAYDIVTKKNQKLATAAVGIVVIEHGSNSLLSRRVLEQSSIKDGMLHALVLAPQSWLELLSFFFATILLPSRASTRLPAFAGHIKTGELSITSNREIPHVIDGAAAVASELTFRVTPEALSVYPGRHLLLDRDAAPAKEIYRVQSLPSVEARGELMLKPLPYLRHAATEDFKDLFLILRENARCSSSFVVLMVLSTLLATCGLYADSGPVIIGAMILAPLMSPIVSLAMGISRQDPSLLVTSVRTLGLGIVLAVGCAAVAAVGLPLQSVTREINARLTPNLLDLGVAIVSGIAGAYAHARQEVARSLAGVAIAVALVPPLVVTGIGLGWLQASVFLGAFLLFLTNLVGILFAAAITFSLLGFSPLSKARRGLLVSLIMVVIISIPLALSFSRLVDSQRTARSLEGLRVGPIEIRDVVAERQRGRKVIRCNLICPHAWGTLAAGSADAQRVYRMIRQRVGQEAIVESTIIYRSD